MVGQLSWTRHVLILFWGVDSIDLSSNALFSSWLNTYEAMLVHVFPNQLQLKIACTCEMSGLQIQSRSSHADPS